MPAPPKSIINQPELQVYISDFGKKKDDIGLIAEVDKKVVGAVWVRIINVLKRGNLSLPSPNHFHTFMSRTSYCSFSQTVLRKSMAWSAVAVLVMLISKVLQKARELSAKRYDTERIQPQIPVQEPVHQTSEVKIQAKPKIPSKPVMSAEAVAYPKLFKIYKELKRQNEIIFEAEKERNAWELERDSLKGIARFTKKSELQSKIDRKNDEIDILKIGLSGIVRTLAFSKNVGIMPCKGG